MIASRLIPEGQYTEKIYTMINEAQYDDAIRILNPLAQTNSRAALSLLAYCQFNSAAYEKAAASYSQLAMLYPTVHMYKLYQAQCYYQAGLPEECLRVCGTIDYSSPEAHESDGSVASVAQRALLLQARIRYENDELVQAKALLEDCNNDDPDVEMLLGGIAWKENDVVAARERFMSVQRQLGGVCQVKYNLSLCHYSRNEFADSFVLVSELVDAAVKAYPNIGIGEHHRRHRRLRGAASGVSETDVADDSSSASSDDESDHAAPLTGKAQHDALQSTCLLETLNLRAAVEYMAGLPTGAVSANAAAMAAAEAAEALRDLPPRAEEELDAVTLHNQAMFEMPERPQDGFRKLAFLLLNSNAPPPTFVNLLLLYCRAGFLSSAADLLTEQMDTHTGRLSQTDFDLINALIMTSVSAEEAARAFETTVARQVDVFTRLARDLEEANQLKQTDRIQALLAQHEEVVGKRLVPAVIGLAKVFWDAEQYRYVEKMLWRHSGICQSDPSWQLAFAHAHFMQNEWEKSAALYEQILRSAQQAMYGGGILDLPPGVLANLCVSYIMTSRNGEAEDVMKMVENAEDERLLENPGRQYFHFCIINLVIGTLYCSKGQFDFGIDRIITSLDPFHKRLGIDTWFYTKRCLLALCDGLARSTVSVTDDTVAKVTEFLEGIDRAGRNIAASSQPLSKAEATALTAAMARNPNGQKQQKIPLSSSVAMEARILKRLVLVVTDM